MAAALKKSLLVHEPPILELRLFEIVSLIKFAAINPTKELVCLAALKQLWPSVFDSTWRSRPRRPSDLRFVVVNCNTSKAIMLTEFWDLVEAGWHFEKMTNKLDEIPLLPSNILSRFRKEMEPKPLYILRYSNRWKRI